MIRLSIVLLMLVSLACTSSSIAPTTQTSTPAVNTVVQNCHARGLLPDASCTPGATNPSVTQDTIHRTICVTGYTKTIRPPVSYTERLKRQQISQYGYSDTRLSDYEEDHLIALELGGSPTDPRNLWPEAHAPSPGSFQKDRLENYLNKQVCSGAMTLSAAQTAITTDWFSTWESIGKPR
jgi:hypothetical protein